MRFNVAIMSGLCGIFVCVAIIASAQSGWSNTRLSSGGKDLNAVYFADSKHGWVGGDGGFLAYTEDSGSTWVERPLSTDRAVNDVYFVGKDDGFALAGGTIFETSNGGLNSRTVSRMCEVRTLSKLVARS